MFVTAIHHFMGRNGNIKTLLIPDLMLIWTTRTPQILEYIFVRHCHSNRKTGLVGRPKGYKCTYPLGKDVPVILTKIRKQPKMHNMKDIDMKYVVENGKPIPFVLTHYF